MGADRDIRRKEKQAVGRQIEAGWQQDSNRINGSRQRQNASMAAEDQ